MENYPQNDPDNVAYIPQIVEFRLTYYMPLLPLWSGIILSTVKNNCSVTDSGAIAENWFRIVNHSILNSDTGVQASISLRLFTRILTIYTFTSLARKVFIHKKRIRIENEEECKEKWSKSKKSKFSYNKPTIEKVSKVFTSSSKCLMNTESER